MEYPKELKGRASILMQNIKVISSGIWVSQRPIAVVHKIPDAETPFTDHITDPGYNLTIVQRCDNRTEDMCNDVNTFSIGMVITPPINYHVEIIPHPQLYKAGYMLLGPLIIPPGNEEEVILPLYKFKDVSDLELPFVAGIMIVRETEYCSLHIDGGKNSKKEEIKPDKIVSKGKAGKGRGNHMF